MIRASSIGAWPPASLTRSTTRTAGGSAVAAESRASTWPGVAAGAAVVTFGPDRDDASAAGEARCRQQLATEDAHLDRWAGVGPADGDGVDEDAEPGQRRDGAGQVAAVGAGSDEDRRRVASALAGEGRDVTGRDRGPGVLGGGRLGDGPDDGQVRGEFLGGRRPDPPR